MVFLGTPQVAANALRKLVENEASCSVPYEVVGVVSQPRKGRGRGRKRGEELPPTPVEAEALRCGFGSGNERAILAPETCSSERFLEEMVSLRPDLCVTAAYGKMLPSAFLSIPRYGTLNVHPSLLPRWRGAAPVQRNIGAGDDELGVSLAYTVLKCDAGPVLASESVPNDGRISAPEALDMLFERGTDMLVREMAGALTGEAMDRAVPQDESQVVRAEKITTAEAVLDCSLPAAMLHNTVRAFAGWPGAKMRMSFRDTNASGDDSSGSSSTDGIASEPIVEVKLLRTEVAARRAGGGTGAGTVSCADGRIHVTCGDGNVLAIHQLQVPGKRAMEARDFINGLGEKKIVVVGTSKTAEAETSAAAASTVV